VNIDRLRCELNLTRSQWREVCAAANDAHLPVRDYIRLMVLAAAGMGGAVEHLARAIDASATVEVR
jgi:hypothetical protein